ncbi:hypothetical protein BDV95DRAFT_576351 [Massariosphaeria phaeospora]|uniref:Uncharacterized protein n=1 Tax=Massariosphaeria phaeospora TaxID=100035 RepID=A0A7C8I725_9PLEO|nr:hypothetical protein BDV95DRAFT_576351 [Massariosphaeria phaeospora]
MGTPQQDGGPLFFLAVTFQYIFFVWMGWDGIGWKSLPRRSMLCFVFLFFFFATSSCGRTRQCNAMIHHLATAD